jgi:hypothetical protein
MRDDPTEKDYILVKAGSTISVKIDLSLAYALNKTGEYSKQRLFSIQECRRNTLKLALTHLLLRLLGFNFMDREFQRKQWESTIV